MQKADEKHKDVLNAQVIHTLCLLSQDRVQGLYKKYWIEGQQAQLHKVL